MYGITGKWLDGSSNNRENDRKLYLYTVLNMFKSVHKMTNIYYNDKGWPNCQEQSLPGNVRMDQKVLEGQYQLSVKLILKNCLNCNKPKHISPYICMYTYTYIHTIMITTFRYFQTQQIQVQSSLNNAHFLKIWRSFIL